MNDHQNDAAVLNHHQKINGDNGNQEKHPHYKLHMFPPAPECYNISPFAIKLESFLRVNQISYENVYTSKFSAKRQIPYVTTTTPPPPPTTATTSITGSSSSSEQDTQLEEYQICDSNVILKTITQHVLYHENKEITDAMYLTKEQRAISHAMIRMMEEHTTLIAFYYRYALHMDQFISHFDLGRRIFESDLSTKGWIFSKLWKRFQPKATHKVARYRGLTRHSNDELWEFSCDDLDALSDLLNGSNSSSSASSSSPWFFGSPVPTTLDCAVFGHVGAFLFMSKMNFPQTAYLKEHCPKLIHMIYQFQQEYWPDWEQKCQRQRNAKYQNPNNNDNKNNNNNNGNDNNNNNSNDNHSIISMATSVHTLVAIGAVVWLVRAMKNQR